MQRQGTPKAFETIVGFGANGSRPHHQPGLRKLRKRDTVLIDYGAGYEGYCSDMTRTLSYGPPTRLFERAFDVVARAQAAAIAEVRAGASFTPGGSGCSGRDCSQRVSGVWPRLGPRLWLDYS